MEEKKWIEVDWIGVYPKFKGELQFYMIDDQKQTSAVVKFCRTNVEIPLRFTKPCKPPKNENNRRRNQRIS